VNAEAYADFLARKQRATPDHGPVVEPSDLHPSLFDFQRDITTWAIRKGRAAIFADCGLGKTRCQLDWARHSAAKSLIVAPLSVARQTVREAESIGIPARYVRHGSEANGPGIWVTNYEMTDGFDPSDFGAVVLDESSILKNVEGRVRQRLTTAFASVPARLACTATPAPNDVAELCNHAEFLGVMSRREMLAAFFVHDEVGWRLKGHAAIPMYQWMAGWAVALRKPSDMGYPDEGYELPPLTITPEVVDVEITPEGQLFATELGGIGGRSRVRHHTMDARVDRTVGLVDDGNQWVVWCGLNAEADAVAASVKGAVNVEGSMTPEAKASALEAFQDGAIRVLVTKVAIAGFGMNFQQCSRMVFLGLSDSYEAYYQAIRRCYRFGQTEPVDVRIVVSNLERQIVDNVQRKEREAADAAHGLVTYSQLRKGPIDERPSAIRDGRRPRRMLASTTRR
jgi:superfamily II DNA or RNA helicase